MAWALDHRQTGPLPAEARLVLVSLADYTDPTGRNAYPSAPTLAHRLGVTVRSVRRALALLLDLGLIRHGDQSAVAHIRADRRPTVHDLALDGVHVMLKVTGAEVALGHEPYDEHRHGMTSVSPRTPVDNQPRGDTHGRHGVTAASPKPSTNPPLQPPNAVEVTTRRASASASRPVPSEPGARVRQLGITDRNCPVCGQPIYRTHRCRASAMDPTSSVHQASIRELYLASPASDEAPAELVMLNPPPRQQPTLDIAIGECQWCGRKVPTNRLGVCLRCAMAVAAYGPNPHPLEVERP